MTAMDGGVPFRRGNVLRESGTDLESLASSFRSSNRDSIRSVQSISTLRNKDASQTMPRNEELTMDLYTLDPSNPVSAFIFRPNRRHRPSKPSETESVKRLKKQLTAYSASTQKLQPKTDHQNMTALKVSSKAPLKAPIIETREEATKHNGSMATSFPASTMIDSTATNLQDGPINGLPPIDSPNAADSMENRILTLEQVECTENTQENSEPLSIPSLGLPTSGDSLNGSVNGSTSDIQRNESSSRSAEDAVINGKETDQTGGQSTSHTSNRYTRNNFEESGDEADAARYMMKNRSDEKSSFVFSAEDDQVLESGIRQSDIEDDAKSESHSSQSGRANTQLKDSPGSATSTHWNKDQLTPTGSSPSHWDKGQQEVTSNMLNRNLPDSDHEGFVAAAEDEQLQESSGRYLNSDNDNDVDSHRSEPSEMRRQAQDRGSNKSNAKVLDMDQLLPTTSRSPTQVNDQRKVIPNRLNRTQIDTDQLTPVNGQSPVNLTKSSSHLSHYNERPVSRDDDDELSINPYAVTRDIGQGSAPATRRARAMTPETATNLSVDEGSLRKNPDSKSHMKRRDNHRDIQRMHSTASSSDMTISFDSDASYQAPRLYEQSQPGRRHKHSVGSDSTLTGDELRPRHKVITIHGRDRIQHSASESENYIDDLEQYRTTPQLLMYEPQTASSSSFIRNNYSDDQQDFRSRTPTNRRTTPKPRSARLNHVNSVGTDKQTQHTVNVTSRSTATTDFASERSKHGKHGRSVSSDRVTGRTPQQSGMLTVDIHLPDSNRPEKRSDHQTSRLTSTPSQMHYRHKSPTLMAVDMPNQRQHDGASHQPQRTPNEYSARLFVNGSRPELKSTNVQTEKQNYSENTTQTRRRHRSLVVNNDLNDEFISSKYTMDRNTGANEPIRSASITSPRYQRLNKTMSDSTVRRAFVKQPSVINRRHRWRTEDMPATDTEDFNSYDQFGSDRRRRSKSQHVAHIIVGDDSDRQQMMNVTADSDDALSVFSEPTYIRRSKSSASLFQHDHPIEIRHSPIVTQSYPSTMSVPMHSNVTMYQPTDTAINLVSQDLSVESSIASVDPELKDARKSGTNYHITLTLSPSMSYTETSTPKPSHIEASVPLSPLNTSYQPYPSPAPTIHIATYPISEPKTAERTRLHSNTSVVHIGSSTAEHIVQPPSQQQTFNQTNSQVEFDIEVESLPGNSDHEEPENFQDNIGFENNPQFEIPLHSKLSINYSPMDDAKRKTSSVKSAKSTLKHQNYINKPANVNRQTKSTRSAAKVAATRPKLFETVRQDEANNNFNKKPVNDANVSDHDYYQNEENVPYDGYEELPSVDEPYFQSQEADDDEADVGMFKADSIEQDEASNGPLDDSDQESETETNQPFIVQQPDRGLRPDSRGTHVQPRRTPMEFTQPTFTCDDDDRNEVGQRFHDPRKEVTHPNFTCEDEDPDEAGIPHENNYRYVDDFEMPTYPSTTKRDEVRTKRQTQDVNQPQLISTEEDHQEASNFGTFDPNYEDLPNYSSRRPENYKSDTDLTTGSDYRSPEDNQRWSRQALEVRRTFEQGEFDSEIPVNRGSKQSKVRNNPGKSTIHHWGLQHSGQKSVTLHELIETLDVTTLFYGAPVTSVRQTIDVERLEDEILTEKPAVSIDGQSAATSLGMTAFQLDYETVSEEIVMDVNASGQAITTARVRCERIVPIRGSDEMYKKSSVIVTRRIEVDLTVTPTRRHLLKAIAGVHTTIHGSEEDSSGIPDAQLSKPDAFKLYQKFMALAEMSKSGITK